MQQRLYRLTKFLDQGLGSAQSTLDDSLNGNSYTDQGFPWVFYNMGISWVRYAPVELLLHPRSEDEICLLDKVSY
jgi:hypothetical protein